MKSIQLLKREDYWTQLKNIDDPYNECQVTAGANFLNALGIYPYSGELGGGERLPDLIDDVATGHYAQWLLSRIAPNYKGSPREIHAILAWAINVVAGKKIDTYTDGYACSLQTILYDIWKGFPVIVGGSFVPDGHVVCITGLESTQDEMVVIGPSTLSLPMITSVSIADSYSNWHTMGTGDRTGKHYDLISSGYDSKFTIEELNSLLAGDDKGNKLAHRAIAAL